MEELLKLGNALEKWAYIIDIDIEMYIELMCNWVDSTRQINPIYADYTIKIYNKLLKDFLQIRKINKEDVTALMSEFAEFLRENAIHAFINPDEVLSYKELLGKDDYESLEQIMKTSSM